MKKIFSPFLSLFSHSFGISGKKYLQDSPKFDLKEYFNGEVTGWGIIQNRGGDVISRFDMKMVGEWQGNKGTLTEDFNFYSGEEQQRVWYITKIDNGNYQATADDIIGLAKGKIYGNAVQWKYKMNVKVDKSEFKLSFDDWMWQMKEGVLVNRSYMKKFGITVAEISIFMKK